MAQYYYSRANGGVADRAQYQAVREEALAGDSGGVHPYIVIDRRAGNEIFVQMTPRGQVMLGPPGSRPQPPPPPPRAATPTPEVSDDHLLMFLSCVREALQTSPVQGEWINGSAAAQLFYQRIGGRADTDKALLQAARGEVQRRRYVQVGRKDDYGVIQLLSNLPPGGGSPEMYLKLTERAPPPPPPLFLPVPPPAAEPPAATTEQPSPTITMLLETEPPEGVSLAVYLANALEMRKREVVDAIFSTGVPVFGATRQDIRLVLAHLGLTAVSVA